MKYYKGLFKYPAIIFQPFPDPLPPLMIICDHLATPSPPLVIKCDHLAEPPTSQNYFAIDEQNIW